MASLTFNHLIFKFFRKTDYKAAFFIFFKQFNVFSNGKQFRMKDSYHTNTGLIYYLNRV